MKFIHFIAVVAVLLTMSGISLWAEDWTTTDGRVYQQVTVVKSEPDAITILYRDGGALIPLAKLPPDLQKRFNYDLVQANAAANARVQADAKNTQALQAEIEAANKKKTLALAAQTVTKPKTTSAPVTATRAQNDPFNTKQFDLNPNQNDPKHYDMQFRSSTGQVDLNSNQHDPKHYNTGFQPYPYQ